MLAQFANQLKPGDEFTTDEGLTWHTVTDVYHLDEIVPKPVVLLTTEEYEKIWLWEEEEVVVRI